MSKTTNQSIKQMGMECRLKGVSNEEMLAMLHSSDKEEETVGPPELAAVHQVPERAQEVQELRRFVRGSQPAAKAHGTRWFQASRMDPP
jgi:hypothetical protein